LFSEHYSACFARRVCVCVVCAGKETSPISNFNNLGGILDHKKTRLGLQTLNPEISLARRQSANEQ